MKNDRNNKICALDFK